MPALTQIPEFYPIEFETNWNHLVQQKNSRLELFTTPDVVNGEAKTINQIGEVAMSRVTSRAGDTRLSDVTLAKRWLRSYPYDVANIFDEWDEAFLGNIVLPKSDVMTAHVNAYNRTKDDVIIAALGGTAYTGADGTTATALGSGQKIAKNYVASGNAADSGLTLAKLIKAKSILGKAEALDSGESPVIAVTQAQLDDLLNNVTEVKSSDYNQVKALYDGNVEHFMGFRFVRLERLTTIASSVRGCYAWVPSAIKFDGGSSRRSYMDVLPQKSHALQVRTVAKFGATRTEEKKVVEIACVES